MRKLIMIFVAALGICLPNFSSAATATTQVDSLIQLLVDKKILTESEAAKLKDQIVDDEKEIRTANFKNDTPQWVQDMKLSGDFRLRYQYEKRNSADANEKDRSRGRIRMRLGVDTKINDKIMLGVGIATSGGTTTANNSNARAGNFSFGDSFAKDFISLNYAYVKYTPDDRLAFTGGQMKNPIWEPMEFLWDSDITPQGGAIEANYKLSDALKLWGMLAGFQAGESGTNEADPFMYVVQGGIQGKLMSEKIDYKIAGIFNGMDNIGKTALSNRSSPATNTTNGAGEYEFRYTSGGVVSEFGLNDPLGDNFPIDLPRVGIFGEYMKNPSADSQNVAWMAGGYLGNSKVSGWGTWKITGAYKSIGKDAWLDILPDSDFYSGATDVKGYEAIFEMGFAKGVSLAFDYYRDERIKTIKAPESLFQGDINFKF